MGVVAQLSCDFVVVRWKDVGLGLTRWFSGLEAVGGSWIG